MDDGLGDGAWRCHREDSPFHIAVLRSVRATDVEELEREADALVALQHPNIGPVLGLATDGAHWFLVCEALLGTSLDTSLSGSRLPMRAALDVAVQLCEAVAASHAAGVVHGGLRPSSVVMSPDGRVRLTGFTLHASLDRPALDAHTAPELAGGGTPTPASDRYSLGILLFELLTGGRARPVPVGQRVALSLDESFDDGLRWVVTSLSHPDPSVRPAIDEVEAHLRDAREALGVSGPSSARRRSQSTSRSGPSSGTLAGPAVAPIRIGRYDVVRELGRGGAGVVYEATDPELRRRVAIKVLLAGTFARTRDLQRFKQEAQAVARLDHDGIVKVLDIGSHLEGAWFAMEFVDGPSLMDRLRAEGSLPWEEAVAIAAAIGRALNHAHQAGLLHRDVKPHNVLLEGGRTPKLADFGLALDADTEATRLTGTGQLLGTPMYMAPEQAVGDLARLGPHTDVYALGVLLYEALTGRVPFDGPTPLAVIGRILKGDARPPRQLRPEIPRPVEVAVLKALRLDPADRYATAAAFADDLERCLRGELLSASEPTLAERLRWFVRANRLALAVAVLVLITAVGAVAGLWGVVTFGTRRALAERERVADETWRSVVERVHAAREAGDAEGADTLFRAFVDRSENKGTQALVRAWWDRADAEGAAGRGEERLSALATAYGASVRPEDQDESLRLLAETARRERRFDLMAAAIDTLRRRNPAMVALPSVRALRRDALAARGDLAGAADLDPDPDGASARVLRALSGGTRTELFGTRVGRWPDGRLWSHDLSSPTLTVSAATPTLGQPETLEVPGGVVEDFLLPFDAGTPTGVSVVYRNEDSATAVARYDGTRLVPDRILSDLQVDPAVTADLDLDGRPELYLGLLRDLASVRSGPGGWEVDVPSPETNAADSQVSDLAVSDLDGDGRPELAVSLGEWSAYDVRLLRADPASGATTVGPRIKLGQVAGLATVRGPDGAQTLLACKHDNYPNARVFPPDRPYGEPAGLWELWIDHGTFEAALRVPGLCRPGFAADFDGDGLDEFAWSYLGRTFVDVRRADGGLEEIVLPQVAVAGVAQLDDDAAMELIVADPADRRRLWVLGAGDDRLPLSTGPHPPAVAPPADVDRPFADSWNRAEDLVYVGELREAADALHELAVLRYGRPEGLEALLRAADVEFAAGAFEDAARSYRDADAQMAEGGEGPTDALRAMVRSLRAAHDDRGEVAALQELARRGPLEEDDRARLDRLAPLTTVATTTLAFDAPLDPRWRFGPDPFALRRDRAAQSVEVEASGDMLVARLPVVWDERWLGVSVDLDLHRAEWSGSIAVGLVPRGSDAYPIGVSVSARGGGEMLGRIVGCNLNSWPFELALAPDRPDVSVHAALFAQPSGADRCDLVVDGRATGATRSLTPPGAAPDGWDLVVRAQGVPGAYVQASLRRIELVGATPDPDAPRDEGSDVRLLADGAPESVADHATGLLAAVAAADLGDRRALVEALERLEGADRDLALSHLLHPRLAAHGSTVRELLGGSAFLLAFERAWEVTLVTHSRTDPGLSAALLMPLDGVEQAEPSDAAERDALALVLVRRGAVASARHLDDVGRSSVQRALELAADPRFPPIADIGVRALVNASGVDLAEMAVRSGDLDRAFAILDRTVAESPTPWLVRDVIVSRPELGPLHDDPRWSAYGGTWRIVP